MEPFFFDECKSTYSEKNQGVSEGKTFLTNADKLNEITNRGRRREEVRGRRRGEGEEGGYVTPIRG